MCMYVYVCACMYVHVVHVCICMCMYAYVCASSVETTGKALVLIERINVSFIRIGKGMATIYRTHDDGWFALVCACLFYSFYFLSLSLFTFLLLLFVDCTNKNKKDF